MVFFSSDLTRDKLILLYFLKATNFETSQEGLLRMMIDKEWQDYFTFSQSFSELLERGFIQENRRKSGTYYSISPTGRQAIESFSARLPQSLRNQIDIYAQSNRKRILKDLQYNATFEQLDSCEYMTHFTIYEEDRLLLSLSLNVVSKETAQTLCNRWESNAQDVYTNILSILSN